MKTRISAWYAFILPVLGALMVSCAGIPKGAIAVEPFDPERYLGLWYEIARLDFRFERDLDNTTARYSRNADGSIRVDNRGYNYVKGEPVQAIGKAKILKKATGARLKVSFFGPFYAGYNVIALDPDYRYALVAGDSLRYLWILSRDTVLPEDVKERYLKEAERIGYDVSALIWVRHDRR